MIVIANNITETKKAYDKILETEQRWRFALEGSNQGVWDWNIRTNEVYFSPSWHRMLGYDENVWARSLNYEAQSADDAIELFRWLRGNTYKLIRNLPDNVWLHTMEHTENGTMTMDDWLHTYEDHISAHVRQMREIFEEWKASQPV